MWTFIWGAVCGVIVWGPAGYLYARCEVWVTKLKMGWHSPLGRLLKAIPGVMVVVVVASLVGLRAMGWV